MEASHKKGATTILQCREMLRISYQILSFLKSLERPTKEQVKQISLHEEMVAKYKAKLLLLGEA